MKLFRKKPSNDIRIVRPGDVVLIAGAAYRIDVDALQRLPIKQIGQN